MFTTKTLQQQARTCTKIIISSIFFLSFFSSIFAQHKWSDLSSPGVYNITMAAGPDKNLRSVRVHIPNSPFIKKFPVIFWLHGTMPTSGIEGNKSNFGTLPDDLNFIAVVPHSLEIQKNGSGTGQVAWNHAPKSPNYATGFPGGGEFVGRDVQFLKLIIEKLKEYAPVKAGKEFYFMGHSSGGFMAMKMGMEVEDCGGISPSGASFHKGSNYAIGKDGFAQDVNYSKLVVAGSAPKVRVVHFQGECDDKALWNGNLSGTGETPNRSTGGTVRCATEKSQLPIYPILGNRFVEGTGYLYAKHNQVGSTTLKWATTDGVYSTDIDFTQYSIRLPSNKDVLVIKIHGGAHAPAELRAMKADRIKLLLGRISDLPGVNQSTVKR